LLAGLILTVLLISAPAGILCLLAGLWHLAALLAALLSWGLVLLAGFLALVALLPALAWLLRLLTGFALPALL
jgi:hypothetical protein